MLRYLALYAIFTASVSCVSEMTYGLESIRGLLGYDIDNLVALEAQFSIQIDKYLKNLETQAAAISAAVEKCVEDEAAPLEDSLIEQVKETLDMEINRVTDALKAAETMNEQGIDRLWSSVSDQGAMRIRFIEKIADLKRDVLEQLLDFKDEINEKCMPAATF